MTIRHLLSRELTRITDADPRPLAQIAASLGFSRQRLNQLRNGDRSAAPEAIEEVLNRLGYVVAVQVVPAPKEEDGSNEISQDL